MKQAADDAKRALVVAKDAAEDARRARDLYEQQARTEGWTVAMGTALVLHLYPTQEQVRDTACGRQSVDV